MKNYFFPRIISRLFSGFILFCLVLLSLSPTSVMSVQAVHMLPAHPLTKSLGDPCSPTITFTHKPPFGSEPPFTSPYENRLYGRLDCVTDPENYKIVVFINIPGWWVKPNYTSPLTSINPDGTWQTVVYTCCSDHRAIKFAAFLYHNDDVPLILSYLSVGGSSTLPQQLSTFSTASLIEHRLRTIEFSGYTWNVKESNDVQFGPGGNYFSSDENDVWVDEGGDLHLTINQRNGKWYSTEVFTEAPMGYGIYTYTLASPIDQLDKNAVLGLFTWDDAAEADHYREIDIEYSRWGQDMGENSQYVVQPFDQAGNRHRFDTILTGTFSTHSFDWEIDQILFSSHQGYGPNLGTEIQSWLYNGAGVPSAGTGNARINLWLNSGANVPPSDGKDIEVVVSAFCYETVPTVFCDVPTTYWAQSYIERLYNAGITGGCNLSPLQYCPETTVTRSQMAVFLLRGIHGSSYNPPAVGGSTGFGDVPTNYWAAAWVKQLAAEGITGGCGSGNYCPEYPVTRDQMAVFLLRSKYGSAYNPPAVGGSTGFGDVPTNHWAATWIKQLVAEGITAGCGSGNYCPDLPVSRAQMAVFLVRTFSLP